MKKKIFLFTLMVFVLVLAFSVSAFAAYEENRTTIDYKGQSVPVITSTKTVSEVASALGNNATMQELFKDDNALVVLADTNGNLFAFPTWYIVEPKDQNTSYVAISEVEYGFVDTLVEGSTFQRGAIRYIEFPHGMTDVRANSVFGGSDGMYETNVTEIHIPSTVSSIGASAFENKKKNSSLEYVYIEKGNTISKISGGTFTGCSNLKYIQFENLTEVTSIDGVSNCNFTGELDLSKCTKLTSIGKSAFNNCPNLTKISLPDSLQTISDSCFSNCPNSYLASEYLPTDLKTIGTQFFYNSKNFNNLLIFPEGFESLGNEAFQDMTVKGGASGNEFNLVFLGEMNSVVYLNGNGHQKHAEKVTVYFAKNSLSDYNQNGFKIKPSGSSVTSVPGAIRAVFCEGIGTGTNGNVTGVEYIYITNTEGTSYTADMVNDETNGFDFDNHNHYGLAEITSATCGKDGFKGTNCIICDKQIGEVLKATGDHKQIDDKDCTTADLCEVCGLYVTEALEHILNIEIAYENGYASAGTRVETCTREGCSHNVTTNPGALLTLLGYSKDAGETRLCVGYIVNREAMAEYKAVNNLEDFEYGFTMSTASNVADGSPLHVSNGKLEAKEPLGNGVIYKIPAIESCVRVDLKLQGDFSDYRDLEILMCAYIYDGTKLAYIQSVDGENAEVAQITPVTIATTQVA